MGIDGPTFVPKSSYFFTNLGQGLSSKVGSFLNFLANFMSWLFLTKCWHFQTRNAPVSLLLAFLAVVFSVLLKYYLKGHFLTKKAL